MKPCDEWTGSDIAAWHHSRQSKDMAASAYRERSALNQHLDLMLERECKAVARQIEAEMSAPPRDFDTAIKDAKALEVDAPAWLPIGVVAGAAMIGAVAWWLA